LICAPSSRTGEQNFPFGALSTKACLPIQQAAAMPSFVPGFVHHPFEISVYSALRGVTEKKWMFVAGWGTIGHILTIYPLLFNELL